MSAQKDFQVIDADDNLQIIFPPRSYLIKNINQATNNKLNVYVKVDYDNRFHVDTLNLYSSGARDKFIDRLVERFNLDYPESKIIEDELLGVLQAAEEKIERSKEESKDKPPQLSEKEKEEAIRYATIGKDYLDKVVDDMSKLGFVGEDLNKKLCILVSISRLLDKPLSCIIKSRASAGKSKLLDIVCEFTPPEDVKKTTRLTPQSLYYNKKDSLKHKLLAIEEEEGIIGADYVIRTIQSSGMINLITTVKEPNTGKLTTIEYTVNGPVSVLISTTRAAANFENETRCFLTSCDESEDQTRLIHQAIAFKHTKEGYKKMKEAERLKTLHRNFQRTLQPLKVFNPYAEYLTFPTRQLHTRRLREFYEGLIEVIAFTRQHSKEIKIDKLKDGSKCEYIEVEPKDIAKANELMSEIIGQTLYDLSKPSQELLNLIEKMVKEKAEELKINPNDYEFNRRMIREYCAWSDPQIRRHIKESVDLEYLRVKSGRQGRRYVYELRTNPNINHTVGLTDIETLQANQKSRQKQGK